jgi:hypothetical protein
MEPNLFVIQLLIGIIASIIAHLIIVRFIKR